MIPGRRRRRFTRAKPVHYQLVPRDSEIGAPIYALMSELVEQHHADLREARIAIAWALGWKPDVDGRVMLGKLKKASDLDRELAEFDFIILLRKVFWCDDRVTDVQRRALLDHELCHAALKIDQSGQPVEDERGRKVFRTRRHDVEEFSAVVNRYGLWTSELEQMANAFRRQAQKEAFQPCPRCEASPGWVAAPRGDGTSAVTRCACWTAWNERRLGWKSDPAA
jgi:hypothetical protein